MRARARGTSELTASRTTGASMPMTLIGRAGEETLGEATAADERHVGQHARVRAIRVLVVLAAVVVGGGSRPSMATSPLASSCSVAMMRVSAMSASGAGPPKEPLCTAPSSVATSRSTAVSPRSEVVSVGTPRARLPDVGDHDGVGGEQTGMREHELLERSEARLFLPFDDDLDPDGAVTRRGPGARRRA